MTVAPHLAWAGPLVVLATLLMWPNDPLTPGSGLDRSWTTGLALAWRDGLHFGDDVSFTYGPLGFALFPSDVSRTGLLVSVLVLSVVCGAYAVLVRTAILMTTGDRRVATAGAIALVVLAPSNGGAIVDVEAIAWVLFAIVLVRRREPIATRWGATFGTASAALLLMKVSSGILVGAAAVVLLVADGARARRAATAAVAWLVTLLVLWVALGQRIGDLPGWLLDVASISSGYSWAMATDEPGRRWELVVALAVAVALVVAGAAATWRWRGERVGVGSRERAPRPRSARAVALWLLGGLGWWFPFKEGFVRHDVHSGVWFFAALLALSMLVPWSRLGRGIGAAATAWVVCLLALVASGGGTLFALLDPSPASSMAFRAADHLVSAADRRTEVDAARDALTAVYQVPPDVLAAIGTSTVHVDPFEVSLVWAYDLRWRPTAVFQRYQAYTPRLDAAGADGLRDPDGPAFVLRHSDGSLDDRFGLLEAPRTSTAILCGFAPSPAVAQTERWSLLERVPDRCTDARTGGPVHAGAGEVIPVPEVTDDEALLVQIDVDPGVLDRVVATLYRADASHLTIAGSTSRILPQVTGAPGPLFVPASAGWPDAFRPSTSPPRTLSLDLAATITFTTVRIVAAGS